MGFYCLNCGSDFINFLELQDHLFWLVYSLKYGQISECQDHSVCLISYCDMSASHFHMFDDNLFMCTGCGQGWINLYEHYCSQTVSDYVKEVYLHWTYTFQLYSTFAVWSGIIYWLLFRFWIFYPFVMEFGEQKMLFILQLCLFTLFTIRETMLQNLSDILFIDDIYLFVMLWVVNFPHPIILRILL